MEVLTSWALGRNYTGVHCCNAGYWSVKAPVERIAVDDPKGRFLKEENIEQFAGCCTIHDDLTSIETLSYVPSRFDENHSIDMERSHARYANIVTMGRDRWRAVSDESPEDWLRNADNRRVITLLSPCPANVGQPISSVHKTLAMCNFDRHLTMLKIFPAAVSEPFVLTVPIESIQAICPGTEFMFIASHVEIHVTDAERGLAVLLEYVATSGESRRVGFLAESEDAMNNFVDVISALCLENNPRRGIK